MTLDTIAENRAGKSLDIPAQSGNQLAGDELPGTTIMAPYSKIKDYLKGRAAPRRPNRTGPRVAIDEIELRAELQKWEAASDEDFSAFDSQI